MKRFFKATFNYLRKSDSLLLVLCLVATVYGVVLISSATRCLGSSSAVYVQLLALFFGIILYFLFSLIDIDILADSWRALFFAGVLLLFALVFAEAEGGNKSWLRFAGIGIQPSEVVKILFIIIIARFITYFSEQRKLDRITSLLAIGIIFGIYFAMIIALSSDMGSALVYFFILAVMLFAGGLRFYWFLIALGVIGAASPFIWKMLGDTHRNRIIALFDPLSVDPTGLGITYQVNRSKAAITSGGLLGKGLYQGNMTQANSIPAQRTDFIFAVAGEELGFIGCAVIIALLLAIIIRCVRVGLRSQSRLGALVCYGIAAMLTFQTFENIGMCIGIAPVIGLTLPFFSSGGSSIAMTFAAMGIVSGIKMKPKPAMFMRL